MINTAEIEPGNASLRSNLHSFRPAKINAAICIYPVLLTSDTKGVGTSEINVHPAVILAMADKDVGLKMSVA
jgi:hypothetical protein